MNRTQTYLIMSHGSNKGILTLQNGQAHLQFLGVGRTKYVEALKEVLKEVANAIGGTLINSPFCVGMYTADCSIVGCSSLGLCSFPPRGDYGSSRCAIMSSDDYGRNNVISHLGQLFKVDDQKVHEEMVCMDGSIIHRAFGQIPQK